MLQTVKFKKQKNKQAEVGSSVDLNGDCFQRPFMEETK